MDSKALTVSVEADIVEQVVIGGDLSKLTPPQRVEYYNRVCKSLNLNPLTRPFDYITLSGKLTLYARKDATEQLRKINGVSITSLEKEFQNGLSLYIVTAHAADRVGRTDASTGAVNVKGLVGDALANAIMKCETKAKRRVTLSICGLGWMDETEVETVHDARPVVVTETGEIIDSSPSPNGQPPRDPMPIAPTPPVPQPMPEPIVTDPVTEPQPVKTPEPVAVKMVKIWTGKEWQQRPAGNLIKANPWFVKMFVGKDKPFSHINELTNSLKKHFGRSNLVTNDKDAMTYDQFAALVSYAWYKQGDKEHGYLDPRFYADKIAEELDKLPQDIPTLEELIISAEALGVNDLLSTLKMAYQTDEEINNNVPFEPSEWQREMAQNLLKQIEEGVIKADNWEMQVLSLKV